MESEQYKYYNVTLLDTISYLDGFRKIFLFPHETTGWYLCVIEDNLSILTSSNMSSVYFTVSKALIRDISISSRKELSRATWLECKDPERLVDVERVLGLLGWNAVNCSGSRIPKLPNVVTRRTMFFLCGRLVMHLAVCEWLRVVCRIIKRRASSVMNIGAGMSWHMHRWASPRLAACANINFLAL